MFDVLIEGGTVIDGTGAPGVRADVAVEGGRIAAIGELAGAEAARTIDAAGQVVAPGFVDIHTHSELPIIVDPRGLSKLKQGVTTEVVGNCGYTPYPVAPERARLLRELWPFGEAAEWTWTDLRGYREAVERRGAGVNIAPLVGHGAVRGAAVGFDDRPATPDEIRAMRWLVAQAMDQGAFGLSTGLTYAPSAYGDTEEIVALASAMADYPGRFYTSHLRGFAGEHISAVEECLDIGRRGGVPVQVSHMAVNDPRHWGEADSVVEVCERGRRAGEDVTFDVYPYAASSSVFSQCFPTWAQAGGRQALAERLREPSVRARIRADMEREGLFRGWPWLWDRLQVCNVTTDEVRPYLGLSFAEIGERMGLDPLDAAIRVMDLDNARTEIIFYYRTEPDMLTFLTHPQGMLGSDGNALVAEGPLGAGLPHPRAYGAHARVLGRYVRDRGDLTLAEAIAKMSGRPADRLGLTDRGRLQVGRAADVVVFDPAGVRDRAEFADPHRYAEGVGYVLVNGTIAVDAGEYTGALAGRVLEAR